MPPEAAFTTCAYCGLLVRRKGGSTRDHVFPSSLYPPSKSESKVQRLTVPTCYDCNNSFSDDEAHFRNLLAIAGEPNSAVHELWQAVMRSFSQADGKRRLFELYHRMVPTTVDGRPRHLVFPGKDERCMRIIRKIVRGLCFYHKLPSPVEDNQVVADIRTNESPLMTDSTFTHRHAERDIVQYAYASLSNDLHSAWQLTFFERTTFIAVVLA